MKLYRFFWSPEGRHLFSVEAFTYKKARAAFKRSHPNHSKYMGEVYTEVSI